MQSDTGWAAKSSRPGAVPVCKALGYKAILPGGWPTSVTLWRGQREAQGHWSAVLPVCPHSLRPCGQRTHDAPTEIPHWLVPSAASCCKARPPSWGKVLLWPGPGPAWRLTAEMSHQPGAPGAGVHVPGILGSPKAPPPPRCSPSGRSGACWELGRVDRKQRG